MTTLPAVRVATDSISDLPAPLAAELRIAVVPATISFGAQTYREGVDLTRDGFYERLAAFPGLPTTAAPGPGAFAEAFAAIVDEHRRSNAPLEGIISLHPPARLSGLHNSAFSGSQMVEGVRIDVVDTGQLSMGVGILAIRAARAGAAGLSMDAILADIEDMKPRLLLYAGLETLEWAARSGRVHRLTAALGNLLAVKPILRVSGGDVSVAERVRTHSRQLDRVIELARAQAPLSVVAVMHAAAPEVAAEVAGRLADLIPRQDIVISEIGCVLGSYTGPGAYGIAALRA